MLLPPKEHAYLKNFEKIVQILWYVYIPVMFRISFMYS